MARRDEVNSVVDFPHVRRNRGGSPTIERPRRLAVSERKWLVDLIGGYDHWRDLVYMEAAIAVEFERQLSPVDVGKRANVRLLGLPRVDALLRHADGSASIVEAKVTSALADIMGGVGQLIYYKTLLEVYEGIEVKALLLAAPFLPPFVLDSIANVQAPVRFLKVAEGLFSGLVPHYGTVHVGAA